MSKKPPVENKIQLPMIFDQKSVGGQSVIVPKNCTIKVGDGALVKTKPDFVQLLILV